MKDKITAKEMNETTYVRALRYSQGAEITADVIAALAVMAQCALVATILDLEQEPIDLL